jgi:hypothetical protein
MPPRPSPPHQLLSGDPYNASLGLCAAFALAAAKSLSDSKKVHPVVSWSLCCYTNWNLSFLALRIALNQKQWDPFLLCNSMGVLCGFRTAMTQGIDDNMRRKIVQLGLPLTRSLFFLGDQMSHTLPALLLLRSILQRRQRVPSLTAAYAFTLASWFAFRQQAMLDTSAIYVPHPWRRAWLAMAAGMFVTPHLVDALLDRKHTRAAALLAALLLPWLSTYLDPNLKAKYDFEYALSKLDDARAEARRRAASDEDPTQVSPSPGALRRVASEEPFASQLRSQR